MTAILRVLLMVESPTQDICMVAVVVAGSVDHDPGRSGGRWNSELSGIVVNQEYPYRR
jgi:hypothetical protein